MTRVQGRREERVEPRKIQVHPDDNVAIVVNAEGVCAGSRFADGLLAVEDTPQAHKVALRDIEAGGPVLRYGQPIGIARRRIGQDGAGRSGSGSGMPSTFRKPSKPGSCITDIVAAKKLGYR